MTAPKAVSPSPDGRAFRHEAFFYGGDQEFLAGTVPFVEEGLRGGEPVMVALPAARLDLLRVELASDADLVGFIDMERLGRNPATIIPAWRDFVGEGHGGYRSVRGIGEPIWPARTPAALGECQHHESLLNLAFARDDGFTLLCPYDTGGLSLEVIAEARRSHPFSTDEGRSGPSAQYVHHHGDAAPPRAPLPEPPMGVAARRYDKASLADVRTHVERAALAAGLGPDRAADLALAVHEAAANSVRHGGGEGVLRVWRDGDALVGEVRDRGHIRDPLAGRRRATASQFDGRGLWMVNHLCDLVELRSVPGGTVVRMHMTIP